MNSKTRKDIIVIGFALFSMFFGAGNVIFPPYLGLGAGPHWLLGFLCYYLADIGLALLTIFAILHCGGTDGIMDRLGRVPSTLMMCAIVLCIGPMLAIPRTAATTFEMSVQPLTKAVSPVVFSIAFFALILALCVQESAVVDIVGKFLTPALLIGLLILIIKGVISPLGPVALKAQTGNVPANGIRDGYQTMDVLAALVFGILVLSSAEEKGHTETKERNRVVAISGLVAGFGLLVVYLGLTYLGATCSTFYSMKVDRAALVVAIVQRLLGKAGLVIFSVVVGLACITTAVALVSSAASYFAKLSRQKLSYKLMVVVICAFSAVVANVGLDKIVSIAAPVLSIVYPPALVLILLSFFDKWTGKLVYRAATLGALITSVLTVIDANGLISMPFLAKLPLAFLGFNWALPAAVFGLIGYFAERGHGGRAMRLSDEAAS